MKTADLQKERQKSIDEGDRLMGKYLRHKDKWPGYAGVFYSEAQRAYLMADVILEDICYHNDDSDLSYRFFVERGHRPHIIAVLYEDDVPVYNISADGYEALVPSYDRRDSGVCSATVERNNFNDRFIEVSYEIAREFQPMLIKRIEEE